jgi:hypothetical protein
LYCINYIYFSLYVSGLTLGHIQRLFSKNNLKYYYGTELYMLQMLHAAVGTGPHLIGANSMATVNV